MSPTISVRSDGTDSDSSGKRTDGSFGSGSIGTNASSASPPGTNRPGRPDEGNERSPALSDEPAGERIPSFTSDVEDFASGDPSLSSPPEEPGISIEPDVNPLLASTNEKEGPQSPSALADRRGKNPGPFRFSQPKVPVKARAQSAKVAAENDVVGSASSHLTVDVDMSETMVNILTKLELLPAVIALRASARPGADPDEAYKAFEHAHKAHDFAERKGADVGLITQCKYYMALSNFATANPDQKRTLTLFKEARSAIGHGDEAEWAGSWVSYVEDYQHIKEEEEKKAEEASSRPSSFLGQLVNPLAAVFGSRPTSADSKVAPQRTSSRPGLFDQMAPVRRGFVATKPAAKRMALSIDSKDFSPPPKKPPRLPRHQREYFLPTFVSSQSTLPDDNPSNSMKVRIRESRIARRDSQGNYEHGRTGLKYNAEHPFGLDVEFVTSPESYYVSPSPSPPIPDPLSTWPASQAESTPEESPPPRKKYFIVNPDPSSKSSSSSSAAASASRSSRADSVAVEETEEEVQPPKRKGSWMKRLSISGDKKLASPTRSLEAMAEEEESPIFQPKGWGELGNGKGGRKGTV